MKEVNPRPKAKGQKPKANGQPPTAKSQRPTKYDRIGNNYNQTRKADPLLVDKLFNLLDAKPGQTCLDVGCGTGNYTKAMAAKGLEMTGIDPSSKMLEKTSLGESSSDVCWMQGRAEELPFMDGIFHKAICTLTIHHWDSLEKGFSEVFRVLIPGGKLVLFTSTPQQMEGYWLQNYFPKMMKKSLQQMPSENHVLEALNLAGFKNFNREPYFIRKDQIDLFLYAGKERPELYLDENVRNGISSFSDLANQEEVKNGLKQLRKDLESGEWTAIQDRFKNEMGDYLFLIAEK
ncbi:MAG: class I SAM-dependent methyltransferase [Saprospiraceae bacterium]